MKKIVSAIILFTILTFLIIMPVDALRASERGLLLWFNNIIPSLLPFMIISNLIIKFDLVQYITYFLYPIFGPLFRISQNGCYALVIGLLCGFPMGGKICSDLIIHNKISKEEGEYLLSFCNNPSPMYMISFVLITSLHANRMLIPMLFCIYIPVFFSGLLYRLTVYHKDFGTISITPLKEESNAIVFEKLDESIMNGFITILKLGGYVIVFSIIAEMVSFIPFPSQLLHYLSISLMEITNGTELTALSDLPYKIQILLLIPANCFGGLSCLAQTQSVIKQADLSIVRYTLSKAFIALLTALIVFIYLF